jgi:hypothetical protein
MSWSVGGADASPKATLLSISAHFVPILHTSIAAFAFAAALFAGYSSGIWKDLCTNSVASELMSFVTDGRMACRVVPISISNYRRSPSFPESLSHPHCALRDSALPPTRFTMARASVKRKASRCRTGSRGCKDVCLVSSLATGLTAAEGSSMLHLEIAMIFMTSS